MIANLALVPIEKAMNTLLLSDETSECWLSEHSKKMVKVHINDWNIALFIQIKAEGLQLSFDYQGHIDTTISGSLRGLCLVGKHQGKSSRAFEAGVSIDGDTELAQAISELMRNIDIDWEEQLAQCTNDRIATHVGRAVGKARKAIISSLQSLRESGSDYLHHEAHLAASKASIEQFNQDVINTRDAVDRLEARINLIEKSQ